MNKRDIGLADLRRGSYLEISTPNKVSRQYLPLYLSEISYRFNHRDDLGLFKRVLRNALVTDREVQAASWYNGHQE